MVRRLAGALARHTGQEEKDVLRHQWGILAISLQRGNSAILGNKIPTYPGQEIDGHYESETRTLGDSFGISFSISCTSFVYCYPVLIENIFFPFTQLIVA